VNTVTSQSLVKWRNYVNCQVCGTGGAYTFPHNFVCYECWSTDASKRGYTGSIHTDSKWLSGHVGRPKTTVFKKANTGEYLKTWQHLVIDIALALAIIYGLGVQA
jgi:hypothetical protein